MGSCPSFLQADDRRVPDLDCNSRRCSATSVCFWAQTPTEFSRRLLIAAPTLRRQEALRHNAGFADPVVWLLCSASV